MSPSLSAMQQLPTVSALRAWRTALPNGQRVGFVPTMGALHAGHVALLEAARKDCDVVVASIFVNPTQFNDPQDFAGYPDTLAEDLEKCSAAGCDAVFFPQKDVLYADAYRYRVTETVESLPREGAHRPGHFDGVLTIVLKLFNLVQPTDAFFGEKDWQQLALVRDMAAALFLPVKVVPVPTVREADGLAMSSRNVRLTPAARRRAPQFAAALRNAATPAAARAELEANGFSIEYIEDADGRRLGAVVLDGVRLIDNVPLNPHHDG